MLACDPLLHEHHYPYCAEFILTGEASALNRLCKRGQRDFPPFPQISEACTLQHSAPLLSSWHPTIFTSIYFCGPPSSFAPSLQSRLSFFLIYPHRSLGVLSHHYCLCLPSLSLLGFSRAVFPALGADIDSPLASSSSFTLWLAHSSSLSS